MVGRTGHWTRVAVSVTVETGSQTRVAVSAVVQAGHWTEVAVSAVVGTGERAGWQSQQWVMGFAVPVEAEWAV